MPENKVLRQLAIALEDTEGTAEALTGADVIEVFDASWNWDDRRFTRTPHRSALGREISRGALKLGGPSFTAEFRGSGSAGTAPRIFRALQACGCQMETAMKVAIGAITTGPVAHGETFTQATSLATGRVLFKHTTGVAELYYVAGTGTVASGSVITFSGGGTCTPSAAPAALGYSLRPQTPSADGATTPKSATLALRTGLLERACFGARGTAKIMLNLGETARAQIDLLGVASQPTDQSLWTTGLLAAEQKPPIVIGLATLLGTYEPIFDKAEIDFGIERSPRLSASDAQGCLSYVVVDRNSKGSINPEVVAEATHPFFDDWWDDTLRDLDLTVGSTAGNRFRFYLPQIQSLAPGEGERDKIGVHQLPFDIINDAQNDQDWTILFY